MKRLPKNPISSENAAKIKSLCASGINQNFCNHFPYPLPSSHHAPTATSAFSVWYQIFWLRTSTAGLTKYCSLALIYGICHHIESHTIQILAIIRRRCLALHPAYRYIMTLNIANTSNVPKSGICKKSKPTNDIKTRYERYPLFSCKIDFFLYNRHAKNTTNHNLKNSDG